jgi:hypothetical protein
LHLVRGHTVSLFSQKVEQEVIYILEEFTQGEMESKEVPSQSLAKKMGTISEPLRQDSPGQLLGSINFWVSPGEGKKVLGLWVDRDSEESIF